MAAASYTKSKLEIQIAEAKKAHLAGDFKLAQKQYEKLLRKAPSNQVLLSLLGGLLLQTKQYAASLEFLRRACAKNDTDSDLHYNLGLSYFHLGDYEKAIASFRRSVSIDPAHDRTYFMMAKAYMQWDVKRYRNEALQCFLKDIEITDRIESISIVAEILHEDRKNEDARWFAKRLLQKDPTHEIGLFVLAKTLLAENYDKALVEVKYAEPIIKAGSLILKAHPNSWRGHHVIAEALAMIGENALALEHYKKVNEILPEFAMSRTNAGVLLLRQGRLREGWEEIAFRRNYGAELYGMDQGVLKRCPAPFWDGQIEADASILIASEQGIGDQMLHSQMLRDLLQGGMKITMTCTPKIVPLMQRSLPDVSIYGSADEISQETLDGMNYKAELLDLGKYLRDDLSKFGTPFYFLKPERNLEQHFKKKYEQFGNKLKVGISWCSASRSVGSIKSTKLRDWEEVLRVPDVQFINVQYGTVSKEIDEVKRLFGVDIFVDDFDPYLDIEKATAQLSALDLLISVSNASVHMSGQLQVPTWVVLNSRPLWHWFESDSKTVWYDSLTLYRQDQLRSWASVLGRVATDLKELVTHRDGLRGNGDQ